MKQQQMNVYARFVSDEPRNEPQREGAKARRTGTQAGAPARSPKPGLKKRGSLPK